MEYSTRGAWRVSMEHEGFMDKLEFPKRWCQYIKQESCVYSDLTALHFLAGEEEADRGGDFGFSSICRILHHAQVIFLKELQKVQAKKKTERNRQEQTPQFRLNEDSGRGWKRMQKIQKAPNQRKPNQVHAWELDFSLQRYLSILSVFGSSPHTF